MFDTSSNALSSVCGGRSSQAIKNTQADGLGGGKEQASHLSSDTGYLWVQKAAKPSFREAKMTAITGLLLLPPGC